MNGHAKLIGRYIVTDPTICHGIPTFRGTQIFVSDVLEHVASGMTWEAIIEEYHNSITIEAIKEAIQLARQAFLTHFEEPFQQQSDQLMPNIERPSAEGLATYEQTPAIHHDLDDLANTWSNEDARMFEQAVSDFGEIDEALWV